VTLYERRVLEPSP